MTKVDGRAPTILTAEGARRLTARIRDAVALADDLLVRAFEGEAWLALGHESWESYVANELPELRMMKLRREPRRERVHKLHEAGATQREIAAATGASLGTINGDVMLLERRNRPAQPQPAAVEYRWQTAVRYVRSARAGLTCLEFEQAARLRHGAASAAMHDAERKGEIRRVAMYRDGYAVYLDAR